MTGGKLKHHPNSRARPNANSRVLSLIGFTTLVIYRITIGKPQENHRKMVVEWDLLGFYPLVMTNIAIENHHFIAGKIHSTSPFSMAMLVYQRVGSKTTSVVKPMINLP